MSVNKVLLIGNVGSDPEIRYTQGNNKVASFRIATSERYKDRNGETRENTEWHTIVVWGKPVDFVEAYIKKGSMVYVEGKLTTRQWTDQRGDKHFSTEVKCDSIQLLGKRDDANRDANRGGRGQAGYPASQAEEDDCPF